MIAWHFTLGLLLSFALLVGSAASAESIHGIVSIQKITSHLGSQLEEIRIRPVVGRHLSATKPLPVETSFLIRQSLGTLQPGDFVVLSGQYLDHDTNGSVDSIYVTGIESVGLRRLIRTWKSQNRFILKFENFNRLVLYRQERETVNSEKPLRLQKLKELNYTLAPDNGTGYSILMVELVKPGNTVLAQPRPSNPVFAGKVSIENENLQLEIFDPQSGMTAEVYSLSPL